MFKPFLFIDKDDPVNVDIAKQIMAGEFINVYYSNLDTFSNKKEEILEMVDNERPDILVFAELLNKKNPVITDAELKIQGYDHFFESINDNDKVKKRRGVIIYTKSTLNASQFNGFEKFDFRESIWCTFKTVNNESVLIGGIYYSGSSDCMNTNKLYDVLKSDIFSTFDRVIIGGDFNHPTATWDGIYSNENDEKLYEAAREGFLTQHVKNPTRYRVEQQSNILDLVFTKEEKDINEIFYCSPLGKSDHVLLKIVSTIPKHEFKTATSKRYDWNKGNYIEFRSYVSAQEWNVLNNKSVEDCWIHIRDVIKKGIEMFIPVIKCSDKARQKPPWMSPDIKKSVKKKYKLFKRYLESNRSTPYHEYIRARNEVNNMIKKAKILHEKKIANESKANPKAFWKHINSFRKCKDGVSALQREDGTLATEDAEKATMLINFFSSVLTVEDKTDIPHIPSGERSGGKFVENLEIKEEQVKEKLKNLNPTKSPGPDKLFPRVLKEISEQLAGPLTILFNKSIQESTLPEDWKLAEITAIFKKGSRTSTNNYRPVSLTCILCKVLESFIRDIVQQHMEQFELYAKCQHGFRKSKSCVTQLLEVINDFSSYIDQGVPFDAIYLDFRKAFDSVPHERLLVKLRSYGIDGKVYMWIKDFLSDRLQYVKVGDQCSETKEVTSGIPQGSILGPILFLIFINDLPDCVQSICHIFADDTKSYNTCDKSDMVQGDIDALLEWSHKWQLFFNCTKCKCLHFGKNNPLNDYFFISKDDTVEIPTCTEEKDLGVTFDSTLKFDIHINNIVKKANGILGLIRRNFKYIDKEVFLKLYKALVRPHLEYGQAIWSPQLLRQSRLIENVQRRATKLIPSLSNLSYEDRLIALKLPSLKYRRLRGDMLQVYKFLKEDKIDHSNLLPLSTNPYNTKGHDLRLMKNRYNCNLRKCSFSFRVVNHWNNLSYLTVHAANINSFKKLLDDELINLQYIID